MPPTLPKWLWYIECMLALLRRILDLIDDDANIPLNSKASPNETQANELLKLERKARDQGDVV